MRERPLHILQLNMWKWTVNIQYILVQVKSTRYGYSEICVYGVYVHLMLYKDINSAISSSQELNTRCLTSVRLDITNFKHMFTFIFYQMFIYFSLCSASFFPVQLTFLPSFQSVFQSSGSDSLYDQPLFPAPLQFRLNFYTSSSLSQSVQIRSLSHQASNLNGLLLISVDCRGKKRAQRICLRPTPQIF